MFARKGDTELPPLNNCLLRNPQVLGNEGVVCEYANNTLCTAGRAGLTDGL